VRDTEGSQGIKVETYLLALACYCIAWTSFLVFL